MQARRAIDARQLGMSELLRLEALAGELAAVGNASGEVAALSLATAVAADLRPDRCRQALRRGRGGARRAGRHARDAPPCALRVGDGGVGGRRRFGRPPSSRRRVRGARTRPCDARCVGREGRASRCTPATSSTSPCASPTPTRVRGTCSCGWNGRAPGLRSRGRPCRAFRPPSSTSSPSSERTRSSSHGPSSTDRRRRSCDRARRGSSDRCTTDGCASRRTPRRRRRPRAAAR